MRKLTKQLIEKSKGAFLLAVELYNKPTISYRYESFSILITNSWELLLKAKIYEDSSGKLLSITRKKKRNEKRQSITIDESVRRVFPLDKDPIRNNIQYVSDLRNESVHLVIDEYSPYYSRAFQSSVLNYLSKLKEWFNVSADRMLPPGLLALISSEQLPNMMAIRSSFNKEDYEMLLDWQLRFNALEKLGDKAAISIQHKIALVKNPKKSDVILNPGGIGSSVTIIERTRDVDESHPYRAEGVVKAVNALLGNGVIVNLYDLQSFLYVNGYKLTNNDYHWKTKFNSDQYSDELINEIYQSIEQAPEIITIWRKQYRNHLRSKH